jgi:hypothetical protein
MPVYNSETGKLMKNLPTPWSLRLQRKKWVDLLSEGIDIRVRLFVHHIIVPCSTDTQWGKSLEKIQETEDSVTLTFADGTQQTEDLLIGAEGAHSPTREYLLGKHEAQLIRSDVVVSFALADLNKEISLALRDMHPRYCVLFNPNGTFAFISGKNKICFSHHPDM